MNIDLNERGFIAHQIALSQLGRDVSYRPILGFVLLLLWTMEAILVQKADTEYMFSPHG